MARQRDIKKGNKYVGCNTADHFIRTYDGTTMRETQFNRVSSIYKNIIKNTRRTIRGYVVTLDDGQRVMINIRG